MILKIDTSSNEKISISIIDGEDIVLEESLEAKYRQSEKLLPFIEEVLKKVEQTKEDIEKIIVNDEGEGFSSLRIGVVTANALAYSLGVDIESTSGKVQKTGSLKYIKPKYAQEPNIG